MYCNACGTALQPEATLCPACGRSIAVTAQRSRVDEHVKLLGILWFAYSILHLLGGCILAVLANTLFVELIRNHNVPPFLQPLLSLVAIYLIVKSAVGIATGWALIHRDAWGRIAALILAFLSLFNIPVGTALGIYTLWVLLSPNAERDYVRAA